jgi:hypothetical protein
MYLQDEIRNAWYIMKKIQPFLQASNSCNNIHYEKFDTGHKSGTVVVLEMLKNIKAFN